MNASFLGGICTDDYVMLFSDRNVFLHGAIKVSSETTKIHKLGDNTFMLVTGEGGDPADFANWASANLRLYKTRNGYELSPESVHHWLRQHIAENLRSENFWRIGVIVGGWDPHKGKPFLGSIDYLGNAVKDQKFLFSGLTGRFCWSIMDALYKPDMTETEGLEAVRQCIAEGHRRVIVALTDFDVMVISAQGVRQLPTMGTQEIIAAASHEIST